MKENKSQQKYINGFTYILMKKFSGIFHVHCILRQLLLQCLKIKASSDHCHLPLDKILVEFPISKVNSFFLYG